MTNDKRACIAFICGMKVNPYRKKQMVFDYSKGEYFHFLVMHRSISGIHVFDYQRNGHVKGAFDMLFDYVANYHVTIEWNKSKFQGFDYESQCYFTGKGDNQNIEMFDYENASYFLYQML